MLSQESHEFLGIVYDMKNGTRSFSQKTVKKLTAAANDVTRIGIEWRTILQVFGVTQWADRIRDSMEKATIDRYHILKFMRIRTAQLGGPSSVEACVWNSIKHKWRARLLSLSANPPIRLIRDSSSKRTLTLVTDASLTGFGGVLFLDGSIKVIAGMWPPCRFQDRIHIAERELAAIYETLLRLDVHDVSIRILVDNMEAVQGMNKWVLRNFFRFRWLAAMRVLCRRRNIREVTEKSGCCSSPSGA